MKRPSKLQMHWLGPYLVNFIASVGAAQLKHLDGVTLPKLVNGIKLKPYRMRLEPRGA